MTVNNFLILTINAIAHAIGYSTLLCSVCDLLKKKKLGILILAPIYFVLVLLTSVYFEAYLLIVLFIASIITLLVYRLSKTYAILCSVISVAICYINIGIINFIYYAMNIPVERIPELRASIAYNTAMSVIYIILSFSFAFIISLIKRKVHKTDNKRVDLRNGFLYIIVAGALLLSGLLAGFSMFTVSVGTDKIQAYLASCNISLLIQIIYAGFICIFVVFSAVVLYSSYRFTKQRVKEIELKKDQEITLLYKNEIQSMYNEISNFKHDYMKIYSSMSALVESGKVEELKDYFFTEIVPLQERILSEKTITHNLTLIQDIIVQGLVYSYALKARNSNIKFHIGISESISPSQGISSVELNRILGILLDNAFESVEDNGNDIVRLLIQKEENETIYQVQNTCNDIVDMREILSGCYTTKGEGRGRGLKIFRSICDRCKKVLYNLSADNGYFTARIIIKD